MKTPDTHPSQSSARNKSDSEFATFRFKDLPARFKFKSEATSIDYDIDEVEEEGRERFLSITFRYNRQALNRVRELVKVCGKSGRVVSVHVSDFDDHPPQILHFGFMWSHMEGGLYRHQEYSIEPNGKLAVNEDYHTWEPTDAKTFMEHFKQFVEDPTYATGELAGHVSHLPHFTLQIKK